MGLGISTEDVETSIGTFRAAENGRNLPTVGRGAIENIILDTLTAGDEDGVEGVSVSDDGGHTKAEVTHVA